MAVPQVDTSAQNLVPDGGTLFRGAFSSTALIPTKILDNSKSIRERTTLYCMCPTQAGTWVIYDIDEKGNKNQLKSVATVANTLNVQNFDLVSYRIYCEFTPSATAGDGSDSVVIRGYCAGLGRQ